MPVYIDRNEYAENKENNRLNLQQVSYDYNYPNDINLSPGSNRHESIKQRVLSMARRSRDAMQGRYNTWEEIDKNLTTYVNPEKEAEAEEDKTKAEPIIVPVSYATLETLLTYMSSAFLEDPLFGYEGVSPNDSIGAILLSLIVNKHASRNKVALKLHTMFRDAMVYGFGAVSPTWTRDKIKVTSSYQEHSWSEILKNMVPIGKKKKRSKTQVVEGNDLENIDPYMYLPDPNFPVYEPQKGKFQGWVNRTTRHALLRKEYNDNKNKRFNAKYLKHIAGLSTYHNEEESGRNEKSGVDADNKDDIIDIVSMYVDIIPSEWELGDSDRPEKWLFEVAGDEVVLFADKVGLNHGKFPVAVAAPDYDGYSISPISKIETVQGLQNEIDWLIKSHIANVKKSINNMLVVDPSMINMNDLKNPEPGGIIRTRRGIWGKGVKQAVEQLKTQDITKGHLTDVTFLSNILDKATGVTDNLQGKAMKSGERVSATEARGIMQSGLSRLGRSAKIMSLQAMYDIGYLFAHHTQQLMSKKDYVSITGEWETMLREEYGIEGNKTEVSPYNLLVDFDVVPKDGSVPNSGDSDVWVNLYSILANNPQLSAEFNMTRIFKHIARKMGAKNMNDFVKKKKKPIKVVEDNKVQNEVRKGNLVPSKQGGISGVR